MFSLEIAVIDRSLATQNFQSTPNGVSTPPGDYVAYPGGALRFGIVVLPFADCLIRNTEQSHVTHQICSSQSRN
jgi:hypothetical protein